MWGAIAGAVVSLANSSKAGDGAAAGGKGAELGAATTMQMYHETADRLQPWVSRGGDALRRLSVLTGLTGAKGAPRGAAPTRAQFTTPAVAAVEGFDAGYGTPGTPEKFDNAGYDKALAAWNATGSNVPEAGFGDLLRKFSMADFETDPGYQFRQEEGEKALTRGASARGMAMSTPGLKDLMRFNQGLASSEYSNAWTRDLAEKNNTFNILSSISQGGQNAAAQVGSAGSTAGNTVASLQTQAGMLSGQSTMMSAGAANQAVQGGLSNYMYNQRYNDMMSRFPAFSSTPGLVSGMPGQFSMSNPQYGG